MRRSTHTTTHRLRLEDLKKGLRARGAFQASGEPFSIPIRVARTWLRVDQGQRSRVCGQSRPHFPCAAQGSKPGRVSNSTAAHVKTAAARVSHSASDSRERAQLICRTMIGDSGYHSGVVLGKRSGSAAHSFAHTSVQILEIGLRAACRRRCARAVQRLSQALLHPSPVPAGRLG